MTYWRAFRFILIFLVLFIATPSSFLYTETRSLSSEYLATEISTRNGLPQNTVYSITCDHKGFIWIGTDRGVSRFDGAVFRHFNMYNTPEIRNNSVTSLLPGSNGTLLIGTYGGGIAALGDEGFSRLNLGAGSDTFKTWRMVRDGESNLWVITTGSELIRISGDGKTHRISIEKKYGKITSVAAPPSGGLLAAAEKGIFRIKNNQLILHKPKELSGSSIILAIRSHSPNELHVSTNHGLLKYRMVEDNIEPAGIFFPSIEVRDTFRDSPGNLWVITGNGLKRLEGENEVHYISEDPFFSGSLLTMIEGPEKNLWIGSSGRGLRILRKRNFFLHSISSEKKAGEVNSICEFMGYIAAGTKDRGVMISGRGEHFSFTVRNGLPSNTVNSVLFHKSRILAGTVNGIGIIPDPDTSGGNSGLTNLLPGIDILSLFQLSDESVLIGSRSRGLYQLKGDKINPVGGDTDLVSLSIFAILENHNKSILLGTDRGVKIFHPDPEVLSSHPGTESVTGPVYELFKDLEQNLWIGTKDQGLFILIGSRLIRPGTINPAFRAPVFRILEDRKKNIWMSTDNGILMFRKNNIHRFFRKISRALNPVLYSQEDGITTPVLSGGSQPAGMVSESGDIYFPSREGITRFDPERFPLNPRPPVIRIHGLQTGTEEFPAGSSISLKHNRKTVSISYSIISFTHRDKAVTKIELSGKRRKWTPHTVTRDKVTFRELPPGRYRLSITAVNSDGVRNTKGASLVFRIRNPFHKTLPFYMILIGLLYVVSPLIYRGVVNLRRKREEQAREKYKYSKVTTVDSHIYINKLKNLMENDKLYLDPNLKIRDLSSRTGIPEKIISQLINDVLNENFKSFVNRYRIEEAKLLLADPDNRNFVLLKIIYDAGFNSKSVFNTAFKKHTGMTPREFRKKALPS